MIFDQTESSISEKDINFIEQFISVDFPYDYRCHLLKYNGGRCSPNIFSFLENGKETHSCIDWFLAIYNGEFDSLLEYIKIYKIQEKRMPKFMVPIAHDPGGNLICISCDKNLDYNHVYFWDHEKEVDYNRNNDSNYSNLYLISKNFENFLGNLK